MARLDRCPLCGDRRAAEDSIPPANLYSEKLAALLNQEEQTLLDSHTNWRCLRCGLLYKREWFSDEVIAELFTGAVATHPKGWDAVSDRFSPEGFRCSLDRWSGALARSAAPCIRRGRRELTSIIESIAKPEGFAPSAAVAAIASGDVAALRMMGTAVEASIGEPAAFRRFAGFRSAALWEYLQSRTGGFDAYAEVGCPLWGLLALAAHSGVSATFLERAETNYWGPLCASAGQRCTTRLLADRRIGTAAWTATGHYPVIGLFQYLDHVNDPRGFLETLFAKTDSAAVILDGIGAPVAVQHLTGWTDASLNYVADLFGKQLHADFDDIRPSGSVLYLLAGGSQS